MILSLVAAAAENNAIGKDNKLLWNLPNDTRFFKNITWAMPVAMGRKTWEALGKTLNGRLNIIITRQQHLQAAGAVIVGNLTEAVAAAKENNYKELMIIGGGEIYQLALPLANKIYLTRVHAEFPEADAFFPVIDETAWQLTSNEDFPADAKHAFSYSFQVWQRR